LAGSAPGCIALVGDSLAAQWPADLSLRAGPIVNLGVGGDRVQDVIWRVTTYPLGGPPPAAVILIAGVNNVPGEAPPLIVSRLGELAALVRTQAPDCRLVVVGVPPRGPALAASAADIAAVNAGLAERAPVMGFRLLCVNDAVMAAGGQQGAQRYFRDRSHFSRAGYQLLAEAVDNALAEP
jgi:platelet-activating factor acetylhydrolase IB subunit beta/gamma